jgi:Flp pilus assembly pilin Flp
MIRLTGSASLPCLPRPVDQRPALPRRVRRFLRRFHRDGDGVAAIEFAFIAPIMLMMLIGIVDISNAVSQNWRLSQLNRTLADLTSQFSTVDWNQSQSIFGAAAATMSPYSGPLPRMSIYNVVVNNSGIATVCWGFHSGPHSVLGWSGGSVVTFPNPAMAVPNSSYIVTAADMTYGGFIAPNFQMSSKPLYFRPRQGVNLGPRNIEQVGQVQNDLARTVYGC